MGSWIDTSLTSKHSLLGLLGIQWHKHSGESVRVEYPRILPSALWKKVKATKNRNKGKRANENPKKYFYMMTGVIRYAHCGNPNDETRSNIGKQLYYCPKKLGD